MTDEHDRDVGGWYQRTEPDTPKEPEFEIIRRLANNFAEMTIREIKLSRELGPEPAPKTVPFWKKWIQRLKK